MDSLIIEATEDSPSIVFNTSNNHFIISGESRPENIGKFYTPIIDWVVKFESYLDAHKKDANTAPVIFIFKLDYFNSSSAKYIMDIILILKKIIDKGHAFNIEWHYDKRDDDMLDAGKEFSEMVNLNFTFVSY